MQNVYQFQPSFLNLMVWPDEAKTEFLLYEDDGLTMAYDSGVYAKTLFTSEKFSDRWVFEIGATDGPYNAYTNGVRSFNIHAHDMPLVESVTSNGNPLPRYGDKTVLIDSASHGWAFDTMDHTLYVKVPETGADNEVVAHFRAGWTPIVPSTFLSNYDHMAVAANFNGWNTAARNMRLIEDYVWAGVISVTNYNGARIKFAADDQWSNSWGDGGQLDTVVPFFETGSVGGPDILVDGTMNGLYTFRFNEVTLEYSVQFAADADSDGDGMSDGWEVAWGLNPLEAQDAALDLNFDGLTNLENFELNTNPLLVDTDGDDYSDLQEAIAGTDPLDPDNVFTWSNMGGGPGIELNWFGLTGRTYTIYYRPTWDDAAPMQTLTNLPGTAGLMSVFDQSPPDQVRFYQLEVERP